MPNQTNSKRVQVSLTPELHAVLDDLGRLQKKPKSRIVFEILEEALPALIQLRDALEQVNKGANPQKVANNLIENALGQILELKDLKKNHD